jgi:hypothetical protein
MTFSTEKRLKVVSWGARVLVTDDKLKNHMLSAQITLCHAGDHMGLIVWDAEGLQGSRFATGLLEFEWITKLVTKEVRQAFRIDCANWAVAVGEHE